ncbi:DUF11 domain-containing protein [Qipengyuania sediminis]|uniref:DUF11 domain-containing protein n=1 Tax=Qipengyuania sediminis TaxID=1532023 RepID=UPI001059E2DF|nr:DUF11 domain-containing protein [Qipengyuania sediminis]
MTRTTHWMGTVSALALAGAPTLAIAAPVGTAAGVDISNTASVSFSVGGTAQPTVTSAADVFKVDRKIDLEVTTQDSSAVSVTLGQANAVTTFRVTNESNATIDFLLAATQQATGTSAKFGGMNDGADVSNVRVFVETNGTAGWQAGDTLASSLAGVASGDAVTVYVVSDAPTVAPNGTVATVILTATAASGATAVTGTPAGTAGTGGSALAQTPIGTANNKTQMETVYADAQAESQTGDGLRDGRHASRSDYRVSAATLTIGKYSRIISDPFSGAASPRAIPGAVVEYCIVVNNTGGSAADAVTISDQVPSDLTYVTSSIYLNGAFNGTDTCASTGGTAGVDATNWNAGTTTVSNNFATVAAGATRTLRFQATIK